LASLGAPTLAPYAPHCGADKGRWDGVRQPLGFVGHGDRGQTADERGDAQRLGVDSEVSCQLFAGCRDAAAAGAEVVEVGPIGPARRGSDPGL
jgi:hypothetical protein